MGREIPERAFPALDSAGSLGGVGKTSQPSVFFPPVVAGPVPKRPKFGAAPQGSAVGAPKRGQGPAFGPWPPTGWGRGTTQQAPGTITSQEQDGIDLDGLLHGYLRGAAVPTLLLAHPPTGFHLAVRHFNLPALPQPSQEGGNRQGQLPLSLSLDGRDQIKGWATVFVVHFLLTHLAVHALDDNQEDRLVGQAIAQEGTQDLVAHLDGLAAHGHLLFGPVAQAAMQPFGRLGAGSP